MTWPRCRRWLWIILLCSIGPAFSNVCRGDISADQFRDDFIALAQFPSRIVGSPGYEQAAKEMERRLSSIANIEWKRQSFPVMTPLTRSATIDLGDGRVERVYPFWPAQVRVCSTPAEGISGKLIYAGECRYEQLRPASMKGQIAVVDASAGQRWMDAAYVGAKAILILGLPRYDWVRFARSGSANPGKVSGILRAGWETRRRSMRGEISVRATLKATVTWERKTAYNYYALVRPPKRIPAGWSGSKPPAALMFSVPLDSTSLVPDLAPGSGAGGEYGGGVGAASRCRRSPVESAGCRIFQRR